MEKHDIRNRDDIQLLLDSFYEKVKANEEIGPIFEEHAKLNWEKHLPRMYDFWETTLFGKAFFKGNPMEKQIALNDQIPLLASHFKAWLSLWHTTVDELFEGSNAAAAKQKANNIAGLMEYKVQQQANRLGI